MSFTYAGRPPVLREVSFAVTGGEVLALVGRSGAGKSTILKLVNRLLLPQSGRVAVEGRDTREWLAFRSGAESDTSSRMSACFPT